jgi:hypothetical protein
MSISALKGDEFIRAVTLPVEDMMRVTCPPYCYDGHYRWFRSKNVVDLVAYRRCRPITLSPGQLGGQRGLVVQFPHARTYAGRQGR